MYGSGVVGFDATLAAAHGFSGYGSAHAVPAAQHKGLALTSGQLCN